MNNLREMSKQDIIEGFIELEDLGEMLSYQSEGTEEFNKMNNNYNDIYIQILYNLCLLNFKFGTNLYYKDTQTKLINYYINKFQLYEPYEDEMGFHLVLNQGDINYYQYRDKEVYIKIDISNIEESYIDVDGFEDTITSIEAEFNSVIKIGEKVIPVFKD